MSPKSKVQSPKSWSAAAAFLLAACSLLLAPALRAQNYVTFTVGITNAPVSGTDTIIINGSVRTWETVVANPATQILIGASIGADATNLLNQLAGTPVTGTILNTNGTNGIIISGVNLTGSVTSGWQTNLLSTNTITGVKTVLVPWTSAYSGTNLAYIANQLIIALNTYPTNAFAATNLAHTNFANLSQDQTVGGVKTFTNLNGTAGNITNGVFTGIETVNGFNTGSAFSSPGSGSQGEQFGAFALATGLESTALGNHAAAVDIGSSAFGADAKAMKIGATVFGASSVGGSAAVVIGTQNTADTNSPGAVTLIGQSLSASGVNVTAIGSGAVGTNVTVIGFSNTLNNFTNTILIGNNLTATSNNQVLIGGAAQTFIAGGNLGVTGNLVGTLNHTGNVILNGTNTFNSAYALVEGANSSLANGINNIAAPTNGYLVISGPTGAFSLAGISGGYDGLVLGVEYDGTQTLTISQESGSALAAVNRFRNGTSADVAYTNSPNVVWFRYNGTLSRWVNTGHN